MSERTRNATNPAKADVPPRTMAIKAGTETIGANRADRRRRHKLRGKGWTRS